MQETGTQKQRVREAILSKISAVGFPFGRLSEGVNI